MTTVYLTEPEVTQRTKAALAQLPPSVNIHDVVRVVREGLPTSYTPPGGLHDAVLDAVCKLLMADELEGEN